MSAQTITVEAVRPDLWPRVQQVFGEKGDPAGCWCQWFKLTGARFRELTVDERSQSLRQRIGQDPAPGVLAWLDGEPAGWAAVEPFSRYPGLARSPITKRTADDPADPWAVTCFVVRADARRRGVAGALLAGAVDFAVQHGATVIEGYPVDTAVRPSLTAAERYHGTVSLFEDAGFRIVRRPSTIRAIMRLERAEGARRLEG
ncbi:GNAT family N-acetyltransferase [Leifsonia poae]|uniref:GNAT family N-acetyltransferase n=1 Tax=Leifsonia poae TaxID=110933 RepID=UPI001CBCFF34|nr:GNAT family N-acetyltransferase [Leifsonia poae]